MHKIITHFLAGAILASMPVAAVAQDAGESTVSIVGSVVAPDNAIGMWSYGDKSWSPSRICLGLMANGGGMAAGNYYYANTYAEVFDQVLVQTANYDMTSGWEQYDNYTGKPEYIATTMAYSPWRGTAYGCFFNATMDGFNFVRWNYDYFQPSAVVCALERPWSACAFDSKSDLYAIERNGDLYKVDVATGELTLVGSTGVASEGISDGTIDPATDIFYWCVNSPGNHAMYSVDIATATATKLYDLVNEEEICGMFIPEAPVSDDVPAKIYSVSANFSGANLTGKLSFQLPSRTKGGASLPADEQLTYKVYANGALVLTGEGLPNARLQPEITMENAAFYCFTVTTSNAAGESPKAQTSKFVGPDTPKPPTTFNATIDGMTVKLTWNSSNSSGVNNGPVVTSAVTYRVVRYPDGKVIADNISERTVEDVIEMPDERVEYYYSLTATHAGKTSTAVNSPVIALGPIVPPVECTFPATVSVAGWNNIDANADNTKWSVYTYDKVLRISGSKGFDDWMISPVVNLKGGCSYTVSVEVKTSSYADETFEVKFGQSPDVESMTGAVIDSVTFRSSDFVTYTGDIVPDADGAYYIGIHAATAEKSNALYLNKLVISDGITVKAPQPVAALAAVAPVNGERKVTVTFDAPEQTIDGSALEALSALTKIEIARDGDVVATVTDGFSKAMSWEDSSDDLTYGKHVYSVTPYNNYGAGASVETEVTVGAGVPANVPSALMVEEGNTGKVTITWEPVTTDAQGNEILPSAVTYKVIDRQYNVIAENLTDCSLSYQAVESGSQAFAQFAVFAVTANGESAKMAPTAYKPVGTPLSAPWTESFASKEVHSLFGYNYIKGNEPWQLINSSDWGIAPQDGDGGFAYFEAYGVYTALLTGKIDLDGIYSPALTYYTYNYGSTQRTNAIALQVDCGDGEGFVTVQTDVVSETGPFGQWNKVVVLLDDYQDKTIIVRFEPLNADLAFYTLDNIRIDSYVERNLTASRLTVPNVVDVDKEFEIDFSVINSGENTINRAELQLFRGEEMVDSKEIQAIEPGESRSVTFLQTLTILDGDGASYKGVVSCNVDMLDSDNETEEQYVGLVTPIVPVVKDLTGVEANGGATLSWSAPDLSLAAPAAATETFEAAESWSQEVSGWKFYDIDAAPVGGIQIASFPVTGLCSWFIADASWSKFQEIEGGTTAWAAHSGNKFIASSYVLRGGVNYQSDDWAVSPRLYGGAQAISFWAKSFDEDYLEDFEILYSASSTNVDDFVSLAKIKIVPSKWTNYRYKLPDGARYFAIRSRSIDKFFLFIDDVQYTPAEGEPAALVIKGYNVYRDGVKITETPVTETTYVDADAPIEVSTTYFVTTVYDNGESQKSNETTVFLSGVEDVAYGSIVKISAGTGCIKVSGADGIVSVVAADGKTVASVVSQGSVSIPVAPGFYIVKSCGATAKVIVK